MPRLEFFLEGANWFYFLQKNKVTIQNREARIETKFVLNKANLPNLVRI